MAEQLRIENEEMRARIEGLEAQEERSNNGPLTDNSVIDPEEQRGSNYENSLSVSFNYPINDSLKDAVAALVRSQQSMMERMEQDSRHKQKVYVTMPEQFNGKVGDLIDAWLKKFETWFSHREQVEGTIEERTRIETAIQNTKPEISLDLIHHEADYGAWMSWEAFSTYMRDTYGSSESGYTRFIQLHIFFFFF
jgi:hypothetical protein